MKKYENLREFLADLVKYGKLYDETGFYIGILDDSFTSYYCFAWRGLLSRSWSPTEPLRDKDLVWCWDDKFEHQLILKFWDAKHGRPFSHDGTRNGNSFNHYEKFTCEWPEWAKEAVKTLED